MFLIINIKNILWLLLPYIKLRMKKITPNVIKLIKKICHRMLVYNILSI